MLARLWRNRNAFTLLVGGQSSSTIVDDSMAITQGSRTRNTIWSSNPITGYILKGLYIILLERHMCKYVYHTTIYNRKDLEPKCPSVIDWIKKMWHIYTMKYYAAIKNDEFMSFVGTWMNLETIILGKVTQEQKIKHRMLSLRGGC